MTHKEAISMILTHFCFSQSRTSWSCKQKSSFVWGFLQLWLSLCYCECFHIYSLKIALSKNSKIVVFIFFILFSYRSLPTNALNLGELCIALPYQLIDWYIQDWRTAASLIDLYSTVFNSFIFHIFLYIQFHQLEIRLSKPPPRPLPSPSRGTPDQLLPLTRVMESAWEFTQLVYIWFIDLEKAYNWVRQHVLWGGCFGNMRYWSESVPV